MRTYRLRIVIPLLLVLATVTSALSQTLSRLERSRSDVLKHGEHTFRTIMAQLQESVTDQMLEGDLPTARRLIALAALDLHIRVLLLADENHRVLAGNRSEWGGEPADAISHYDRAVIASLLGNDGSRLVARPRADRIDGYFTVVLGMREGELRPDRLGAIYAEYDLSRLLADARNDAYRDAVRICAVFLAVALALAVLLHVTVTRPVERLTATVGSVAAGDASARSGLRGRGEIAHLAAAFDAMADRLAANQEALREKTEELNRYFNLAPDLLCITDMEGFFRRLNPAWETILGHRVETSQGRRFFEFLHPDDVAATARALEALTGGKPYAEVTNRYRHRDGSYRWLEWRGTPYQGRLIYAAARDITERKTAEEGLRRSEERYRRIVETAHEGIWVIDAANRTTFANRQMAEMLGYTVAEMQGASLEEFMDEEGRRITEANVARRRRGIAEQHDFKFRRKDGTDLWVLIETTPFLDERGEYAGALGMVTDVTERRRMEEQLRQSQKLEAVGRLAGGVAHDFNNLLTAVLGDAQMLVEGLHESDPLREEAREIQEAARKAAALTRQLLAFGRKEAARPRVLDLGEVVSAMDRMLRRLIGEDVELVTVSDPELGHVRVDPGRIEQVILNLALNARDAMPKGGRLTIETANVQVTEDESWRHIEVTPGPHVMLAVSDTGCGMSPEVRSHLFEPFFTTKQLGKGTGLGLATVYGIVKQCGGDIWVYSEPGKGTVFKIYFPRVDEAVERPEARAVEYPPSRGTETVLVVEDESMVRSMAVKVLRGAGYDVLEAGDGEEALRLVTGAKGRKIDLLVTDVVMPRLGGPELASRLRARMPDLRVLFVSGYTDQALDLRQLPGERTAFLSKPFSPSALAQKIREVLDQRDWAAQAG